MPTEYVNSSGKTIHKSNDKLPNAVTVIANKNLGAFNKALNNFKNMAGAEPVETNDGMNKALRNYGATYDIGTFQNYANDNKNDVYTGSDFKSVDGNPLFKEHGSELLDKGGKITIGGNKDNDGSPNMVVVTQAEGVAEVHIHQNEGRAVMDKYGNRGRFESGVQGMGTDIQNSKNKPGSGYFDVVVTPKEMRFFNSGGVVKTVPFENK